MSRALAQWTRGYVLIPQPFPIQWRIQGGGGATGARPPKIGSTVIFFITHFVSECLNIGLR